MRPNSSHESKGHCVKEKKTIKNHHLLVVIASLAKLIYDVGSGKTKRSFAEVVMAPVDHQDS